MAKEWKQSDEEFLKKHYHSLSNAELAGRLGVTKKAVETKLGRMGLSRGKKRSSRKKLEGCQHRYSVLAISRGVEYLQCVVCRKKQQRKIVARL